MTDNRITFYTLIFLLIVGLLSLIFYSVTRDTTNSLEQIPEKTDINIPTSETIISAPEVATEKIETPNLETQATSSQPKTLPKSETKTQDPKISKPTVEAGTTKQTFASAEMLALHNTARKELGIAALTYSPTLALSAQKWSEELQRDNCEMRHDENIAYGENLYWDWQTGGTGKGLIATPAQVIGSWVSEKIDYNYTKNSCSPGKQCGHYTQIVWEETTEVGCGVSICRSENTQKEIWVCRYNPPGNYYGEKPY